MSDYKTTFILTAGPDGTMDWGSEANLYRLREWLRTHPGKKLRVEPIKEFRTFQQHKYYHLYLDVVSTETGHDHNELHEFFKRKFLPPKFIKVFNQEMKIPRSTTELSKHEMGEYLDRICHMTEVALPDREAAGYILN